jgi:hypothetical protein
MMVMMGGVSLAHAQPAAPARTPAMQYSDASGCAGLFLYAWNGDRSEVLTLRADRDAVPLPDGTTTLNLSPSNEGLAVRVELTAAPRGNLPFCSDAGAAGGETPVVWTATAGVVKIMLKRRPNAPVVPVNVSIDGLVLQTPDGASVKQRRQIRFAAAVADLDR